MSAESPPPLPDRDPPTNETWEAEPPPLPVPHSGLGIASTVFGLVSFVAAIASIGYMAVEFASEEPGEMEDLPPALMAAALVAGSSVLVVLLGLVLGIAGLAQPGRRKTYAVVGTIGNGLMLLILGVLMLIGMLSD